MSAVLVKELLAAAGEQLRDVSDSPRLDAELLLGKVCGWSWATQSVTENGK